MGVAQNIHPFCVRGHEPVLDPVMNHLYEMARAVRTAMQVAMLCRAARDLFTPGRPRRRIERRRERRENRIEMLDDAGLAADHLAEAAFQSPDAAARARIDVMDPLGHEHLGAVDVIDVGRVPTADDAVALLESARQILDGMRDDSRWHQHPGCARLPEPRCGNVERRRAYRSLLSAGCYG